MILPSFEDGVTYSEDALVAIYSDFLYETGLPHQSAEDLILVTEDRQIRWWLSNFIRRWERMETATHMGDRFSLKSFTVNDIWRELRNRGYAVVIADKGFLQDLHPVDAEEVAWDALNKAVDRLKERAEEEGESHV